MNKDTGAHLHFFFTVFLMLGGLYLTFLYAPTEVTMGNVQRIFYFHVPSAWISFLAFGVTCYGSVAFLTVKDLKWDRLASASAEIGLIFCSLALLTGSLWAKPVWGIWWTWDYRLTSTLVLWLIFVSYIMLRGYIEQETKRAYMSAVVGIIGFLDIPIVYFSIRWWRTQHPSPVLVGGEDSGLEPPMLFTLLFCVVAFTVLYHYLLKKRIAVQKAHEEVDYLHKLVEQQ
ncbi:cytochrome c biogenesis protein [candidate division KSB1 bacterium]